MALTGNGLVALTDDTVTVTSGETLFNPLANDDLTGTLTITGVSDANITILGRTLIIPDGFTGTFTYTVSNGTISGQGTVTVLAGTPAANPTKFNGVLTDAAGKVVGSASVSISSKGAATVSLVLGTQKSKKKFKFASGSDMVTGDTPLGTLTLTRVANGTVTAVLVGTTNAGGTLHAAVSTAAASTLHIALASIDSAIPGGGYAIATTSKKGTVKIAGILPDGNAVSAGTTIVDNGSIAFFTTQSKKVNPAGVFGGQLTPADLDASDATGELVWSKPQQSSKGKGTHLEGVDTVLTARGSFYSGSLNINNLATLTLSGGNLAAIEIAEVDVANGIPATPTGSLTAWTGVKAKVGKFSAKVQVPTVNKPVKGSGLYLPKSGSAWGYFPGTTAGGRIELRN